MAQIYKGEEVDSSSLNSSTVETPSHLTNMQFTFTKSLVAVIVAVITASHANATPVVEAVRSCHPVIEDAVV